MPHESPVSAARFSISIDGVQIASFAELITEPAPGKPARSLQPHELTHVVQQRPPVPARKPGRTTFANITLKRGVIDAGGLDKLKLGKPVVVSALDAQGRPGARITLLRASVAHSKGGGNAVAIEELVIQHEGVA